jgi:hypothetical protein
MIKLIFCKTKNQYVRVRFSGVFSNFSVIFTENPEESDGFAIPFFPELIIRKLNEIFPEDKFEVKKVVFAKTKMDGGGVGWNQ